VSSFATTSRTSYFFQYARFNDGFLTVRARTIDGTNPHVTMHDSVFLFTCCQTGAEAALKKELAREHPDLRFAYSRPGFVTFKRADGSPVAGDFELRSVFARAYGVSCGKATGEPAEQAAKIATFARELAAANGGKLPRLHLWERDQHFPGDEPLGFVAGEWAREARAAVLAVEPGLACNEPKLASQEAGPARRTGDGKGEALPADGELVLDVVCVDAREWWYGYHRHSRAHSPYPGGRPAITMPEAAPSRAYIKLEEAIRWARPPLKAGDIAVEIGSAPGGASYALIQRGLRVVGIDPGEMDARVLASPSFKHIRRPVAQVPREELPTQVEWLLLDMNVEPRISLFAVDRLATRLSDTLLGVFLTVKLNQWRIADEIPSMLEHVRAMGMVRARATQLPSNRQEILVFGLTQRGQRRAATERPAPPA
jgi:23S rRNA (cytidine2498-2'-O)-methyltransferase